MEYGEVISSDSDEKYLMTRPDGFPANVPGDLVEKYERKGYRMGYSEAENRQNQLETRILNEERAKFLEMKAREEDKKAEAAARRKAKEMLKDEFGVE